MSSAKMMFMRRTQRERERQFTHCRLHDLCLLRVHACVFAPDANDNENHINNHIIIMNAYTNLAKSMTWHILKKITWIGKERKRKETTHLIRFIPFGWFVRVHFSDLLFSASSYKKKPRAHNFSPIDLFESHLIRVGYCYCLKFFFLIDRQRTAKKW